MPGLSGGRSHQTVTVDAANVLGLQSGMVAAPDCTTMHSDLIDQIYEAAFRSECWTSVLEGIGATANSASGLLVVFDEVKPIQYKGTPVIHDIIRAFCETHWRDSRRHRIR